MLETVIRCPNGAALFTLDSGGDGPAVVFCHPHSGNAYSWSAQFAPFRSAGFRVIAYSRRGYHGSPSAGADAPGPQADDLASLLDALEIEVAHVIGSAAGGSTALDFALAYPDRTASAVIASSLMSIKEADYQERSVRCRGPWFEALPVEARELSASFRAMEPEGVVEWLRIWKLNGFAHGERPVAQPLKSRIDWGTLGANAVPMLLMTGDADLYLPPELLRWTAPKVGNAEAVIVPDAGHPTFVEQAEAFNRLTLEFINRAR